jgi:AcrR family transcriptional regulator
MGPAGSANWTAMLEGAVDILREEGYAALTSRRVAERVGVKQRLVYYYFPTMDHLIVEAFNWLAKRDLERLNTALQAEGPLREIWDLCIHPKDARIISEFMALANHIEALRAVVIQFIETSRKMQIAALTKALGRAKGRTNVPPAAIALFATSLALAVTREVELGVSMGHREAVAAIEQFLKDHEPQPRKRKPRPA